MGVSTYNLAYIKGGIRRGGTKMGELIIGDEPNNIPDIAEAVISVRPVSRVLNSAKIIKVFRSASAKQGVEVEQIEVQNDYAPFFIPREQLGIFESAVRSVLGKVQYGDISKSGYFDAQLLNEKLSIKAVIFGPKGDGAHAANEWVDIKSLEEAKNVYVSLIKKVCV